MLTEESEGSLQEMFTDPQKEKCTLAGAGSLGPREKAFSGLTGHGAGSISHQPCSGSVSLHGVTLGSCPPCPVGNSLGVQTQWTSVPRHNTPQAMVPMSWTTPR